MRFEDASGYCGVAEAKFTPASEDELVRTITEANEREMPLTVVGGGTGVTGGSVPDGGWLISLDAFQRLEIGPGQAVVGAGVLLRDLHAAAAASGQLYPPDPTETTASIGGTVATNASGSRSFRFGATRMWVEALRVAFMDGTVKRYERGDAVDFDVPEVRIPSTKHSAGYPLKPGMDYVDLLIGSEGTLGVLAEAELKLIPAAAALLTGVVFFSSDESTLDAVDAWRSVPQLQMMEYIDCASLDLLRSEYAEIPSAARAALLVEQELQADEDNEIDAWEARLRASIDSWFGTTPADRHRFRRFRHALPEAVNELVRRNGFTKVGSDYAVPIEQNRAMLEYYRQRLDADFPGGAVAFGHIGDAHLHVNILPSTDAEFERGREVMVEFARKAVALGGSVAAEHGLGKHKKHLLMLQYDSDEIEAMRQVKRRLDPKWLLGRGNLFPFESDSARIA